MHRSLQKYHLQTEKNLLYLLQISGWKNRLVNSKKGFFWGGV